MRTQKEQERVQMIQNISEWKKAHKCFWYHHSFSKIWKFAKLKRKEGRKEGKSICCEPGPPQGQGR